MNINLTYTVKTAGKKKDPNQKFDKAAIEAFVKEGVDNQTADEYIAMIENLQVLDVWCQKNGEEEFCKFFRSQLTGAYCRYRSTKKKVWGPKKEPEDDKKQPVEHKEIFKEMLLDVTPSFSISGVAAVATGLINLLQPDKIDWTHYGIACLAGALIGLPVAGLNFVKRYDEKKAKRAQDLEDKHKYYETWVRHTLCHSRLELALARFVTSSQSADDFKELAQATFDILEQNLDQFAINTCPNGMAPRESAKKRGNKCLIS